MTTSQMIADFTTLAIQAGGWMELDKHIFRTVYYQ